MLAKTRMARKITPARQVKSRVVFERRMALVIMESGMDASPEWVSGLIIQELAL